MKKVSEYSDRIIDRLKRDLSNELILSITDMLQGTDEVTLNIAVNRSTTFKTITPYYEDDTIETIEVYEEYYEQDGKLYSGTRELTELGIEELLFVWNFLKEK